MTGIIYIATNQDNLKSYVGQTTQTLEARKCEHQASRQSSRKHAFANALRKYPDEVWEWRVLEADIPLARLNNREELWIAFYDTFHNGYNCTAGGNSSPAKSPEVRAKISATLKAQGARGEHPSQSSEARERYGALMREKAQRGEHPSQQPEVNAKRSATQRAKATRGEHASQRPDVQESFRKAQRARAEEASAIMLEKSARGELWNQDPVRMANDKAAVRRDAGQQFFLDMELTHESAIGD